MRDVVVLMRMQLQLRLFYVGDADIISGSRRVT